MIRFISLFIYLKLISCFLEIQFPDTSPIHIAISVAYGPPIRIGYVSHTGYSPLAGVSRYNIVQKPRQPRRDEVVIRPSLSAPCHSHH